MVTNRNGRRYWIPKVLQIFEDWSNKDNAAVNFVEVYCKDFIVDLANRWLNIDVTSPNFTYLSFPIVLFCRNGQQIAKLSLGDDELHFVKQLEALLAQYT